MKPFAHKDESRYALLPSNEAEELATKDEEGADSNKQIQYGSLERARAKKWRLIAFAEFLVIAILGVIVFKISLRTSYCDEDMSVYAPAREALEYETVVFHNSLNNDTTPYQGPPSPELDARWEELYDAGITKFSREEAARFPNRTSQIPDEPGQYIGVLGVFHELHCLNWLRQTMYPDHYPERDIYNATIRAHMEHCIDMLRQSVMCYPDLNPVVFQWSEKAQESLPTFNVVHRCAKFERLQEWATARKLQSYNNTVWVEGNPLLHGGDLKHRH